jgi:DUF4097 and DUF4098 domain-containing protein YvlB
MKPKISWCFILVLALIAMTSTACNEIMLGGIEDNLSKSFQVQPGGKLTIDSSMGSIEVTTSSAPEVKIDIQRTAKASDQKEAADILKDLDMNIRQQGNDVLVEAHYRRDNWGHWGGRLQLKYIVQVPQKYNLDLKTGGGSIHVSDLDGSVNARTSGGSLHFGQINGSVIGKTSGGSITLDGGSGAVDVDTSGGSIQIGKVTASVKAHTSGGSITLEEVMGTVQATTSGGSVTARLTKQPEGDCQLSTSGGSVHVKVVKDLNLNLRAHCSGGSIRTDLPVTVQGEISRNKLEAKLNKGGPELYLHTSGGGISIESIQ